MKKFISVIVVGMLLLGAMPVMAATNSLIGQKVQGLFAIEKGGKKVADAVVINGVAYAPVKAVADATGASLTVEGKKIIMADGAATSSSSTVPKTIDELKVEREKIAAEVEIKNEAIAGFQKNYIDMWDIMIAENPNSTNIPQWQAAKERYTKQLDDMNVELAELQKQLDSIDAQIAELQK